MSANEPTPASPRASNSLEGASLPVTEPAVRQQAIEQAFDYRGDVTVHTIDGKAIEGYLYDRRLDIPEPIVRMIPKDGSPRINIALSQIVRVVFTGRDTATGKSWETWMKKYHEKKAKGESASIEADDGE
jgi:hypothetical protein